MASSPVAFFLLTLLLLPPTSALIPTNSSSHSLHLCKSTPFPQLCFDSLKLFISISINPSILSFLLHSLDAAVSAVSGLSPLLTSPSITESQRGALQDCRELHSSTLSSLRRSLSLVSSSEGNNASAVATARAHLSAALTNRNTCLEGLSGATGPQLQTITNAWSSAYRYVRNSLSLISSSAAGDSRHRRRVAELGPFPAWLPRRERLLLEAGDYGVNDPAMVLTVAADRSGNFTTVSDAVAFAPNSSADRTIIIVRSGVYDENVQIPSYKTNIALLGEGRDVTIITGNRSAGDGWTTFRSATVGVAGEGFLARDITFRNTAGPAKGQAVALRINGDLAAVYRCSVDGYQDTLYVHSFRQFFRECDVHGTVDFIFGNGAAVLQGGKIVARKPFPGQSNVITAQSRDDPNEPTGISVQNCSVLADDDLPGAPGGVRTYLGRPWRPYSTAVFMESFMDELVDPAGWTTWSEEQGEEGMDTVYYGEYMNDGPGAAVEKRVAWPGYHMMEYEEAYDFTVSEFIYGDMWLDYVSVPYDDGI
ncbi:putative pectinesterase/pectinesterase inhibitor 12 [Apostasia shenzhenica]|uniref:Pectinesterase n=1 Tax=Apostasia shenzhenica TaxID=1088818 RepID=A0A2I0B063_9ASPA|nr:putative pectinesterase/pectinesterase inhibitor 12 [Apostasia shenzhenica]